MGIKKYGTSTPGRRWGNCLTFEEITKTRPEKSLTEPIRKTGGRNNYGRKTVTAMGGGHKQRYRIIDFKYSKKGLNAVVEAIEYDPNRSANISLMRNADGAKTYMIAPDGLVVGSTIECGPGAGIEVGNSMPLRDIPLGTFVYCVEMEPGKGAKIARSAGMSAIVAAKDAGMIHLRMPSGEIRLVRDGCYASIGRVGNLDHENVVIGKAGRAIHMGIRPKSRAVVKNPVDHPMGGGEGKSSGGRHPCTPWGKITRGLKTRNRKKASSKMILKRRK